MKNFGKLALRRVLEMGGMLGVAYFVLWLQNVSMDAPGVSEGVMAGVVGFGVPAIIGNAYDSLKKSRTRA